MAHNNLSGHLDSDIQSDEDAEKLAQAAFDQRHQGLLRKAAELRPGYFSREGFKWIQQAVSLRWPKGLAALLESGGARMTDANGEDALMRAVKGHQTECLLAALPFCDPRAVNSDGATALMLAIEDEDAWQRRGEQADAIDALAPLSDVDQEDPGGANAFELAILMGGDFDSAMKIAPFVSDPVRALKTLTAWHENGDGHDVPCHFDLIDELGHRCVMTAERAEWFRQAAEKGHKGLAGDLPKTFASIEAFELRQAIGPVAGKDGSAIAAPRSIRL